MGIGEDRIELIKADAPAMIAGAVVFNPLRGEIVADFEIGNERRLVVLTNLHRIAGMIVMAMGEQHMRGAACMPHGIGRRGGIAGDEGIDEDDGFSGFDPEGGMADEGDVHGGGAPAT